MASEKEWESLKSAIRECYISEDKPLKTLIEFMESTHNFRARSVKSSLLVIRSKSDKRGSKSQYEHRLRKWGFRKNFTRDEWRAIHYRIDIRKRLGKDSDLYVGGTLISQRKLRKEISRNTCISTTFRSIKGISLYLMANEASSNLHLFSVKPSAA